MQRTLQLHPDSQCMAATRIAVDVARPRPGQLVLRYVVTGKIGDLSLPPVAKPTRTDELWQHTCFEAFIRASSGAGYCEFNVAPSTQWAAYRFTDYRRDMSALTEVRTPRIDVQSSDAQYELNVSLELDQIPNLPSDSAWRLGLSAVIEEANGRRSYWALAHPPGKADFHHSDCFALVLPAP